MLIWQNHVLLRTWSRQISNSTGGCTKWRENMRQKIYTFVKKKYTDPGTDVLAQRIFPLPCHLKVWPLARPILSVLTQALPRKIFHMPCLEAIKTLLCSSLQWGLKQMDSGFRQIVDQADGVWIGWILDRDIVKQGLNQMDCDSVYWWIRWMECESDGSWNCEARPESGGWPYFASSLSSASRSSSWEQASTSCRDFQKQLHL